jgi:hypothetical protein
MRSFAFATVALSLLACPGPGPAPGDGGVDAGPDDAGFCPAPPAYTEDVSGCAPAATDYQPRVNASADDAWPACISDPGTYSPIDPNISTVARVAAFEDLARLLWRDGVRPSPEAFIDARVLYAQDQGLDSRVQRREDVHYPPAPMPCSTAGIPEQYPRRCVGPATLLPLLNDAFVRGAQGEAPRVQAARVEAALLWFLYVSALSEVMTCTERPRDCDSSWAYAGGGTSREAPLGLGRAIRALGVETWDRAYDASLGVRCWRNLDNETGVAMNLALRDQVREQLDRALLRGVALVLRQRVAELACSTGEVREARLASLRVLGPLLDRAARERDVAQADLLAAAVVVSDPGQVDVPATLAALDALFPCP